MAAFLVVFAVVACGEPTPTQFTEDELSAARDRLRPIFGDQLVDDYIERCLIERGATRWHRSPGGGFSGEGITPLEEAAMQECQTAALEEFPNPPQAESPVELAVQYELYMKQVECLEGLGYNLNPPSLTTYIEGNGSWFPYRDLPQPTEETWTRDNKECPQSPWAYEGT